MIHNTKTSRVQFAASLLGAVMLMVSGLVVTAVAQESAPQKPATKRAAGGGRDPFRRYEPPKPTIKRIANQSPVPTIQDRIANYKAQRAAAMNARMAAPTPTTALLLSEIQVIGISRTP